MWRPVSQRSLMHGTITGVFGLLLLAVFTSSLTAGCKQIVASMEAEVEKQTVTVQENRWHWQRFTYDNDDREKLRLRVQLELKDGPPIDVYLVDAENLKKFENGEQFAHLPVLSNALTSVLDTGWFKPETGEYYLLLDNTNRGDLAPPALLESDITTVMFIISVMPN